MKTIQSLKYFILVAFASIPSIVSAHAGEDHTAQKQSSTYEHLGHIIIFGVGLVVILGWLVWDVYKRKYKNDKIAK